jgi:hypothetical protein
MDIQNFHIAKLLVYTVVSFLLFILIYLQIKDISKNRDSLSLWKTYRLFSWFLLMFGFLILILIESLYVSGMKGGLRGDWEEKIMLAEIITPPTLFMFGLFFNIKSIFVYQNNRKKEIKPRTWEIQKIGIIITLCLTFPLLLPVLIWNLLGL